LFLGLLLGCAGNPDSRPNWAEAADIDVAGFASFGWRAPAGEPATILDNQIREGIRSALTAKGYVEAVDEPDLLITHETIEAATVRRGNPVRIGIGVGSRGGNVGGSVGTSVDVGGKDEALDELRVNVQALERVGNREAWVGTSAPLDARPQRSAVGEAVAGLMKGFPVRRR
jgi:hypothetical protein